MYKKFNKERRKYIHTYIHLIDFLQHTDRNKFFGELICNHHANIDKIKYISHVFFILAFYCHRAGVNINDCQVFCHLLHCITFIQCINLSKICFVIFL